MARTRYRIYEDQSPYFLTCTVVNWLPLFNRPYLVDILYQSWRFLQEHERLNATFRQRLAWLARRTRHLAQQGETLSAGMFTVGCFYNFCDHHHSLRLKLSVGRRGYRWVQRTPAIAAGLTDHRWSVAELFNFKVPPPRWEPPKKRGRPSQAMLALIEKWC